MKSLFVVGCPRSGTTLLQSLLATQPGVTTFTESHFFDAKLRSSRFAPDAVLVPNAAFNTLLTRFVSENGFDPAELLPHQPALEGRLYRLFGRAYARRFMRVLDTMAERRGALAWIEKTPGHLRYIEFITRARPHATFIHVIREATANITSLFRAAPQWNAALTTQECVQRWNEDIRISASYVGRARHIHVTYDELIETTASAVQRICDACGVKFDALLLKEFNAVAKSVVRGDEVWKGRNVGTIERGPNAFEDVFAPREQEAVRDIVDGHTYDAVVASIRSARQ
jgi:LPS sulfotransferase NodH